MISSIYNKQLDQPGIIVLVGLPGSGKSTLVKNLCKFLTNPFVVDTDAIVAMVHGGDYTAYRKDYFALYHILEMQMILTGLQDKRTVIIDKCCEKRETRARFLEIAHSLGLQATVIVLPFPSTEILLERRMVNPRGLSEVRWRKIIQVRYSNYEVVDASIENFDSVIELPKE